MLSLRRRKSLRGRVKNALDRATGWFVVTIVGLLVAITAFTIVRFEQWLFDLKEGYCTEGIFRAKRFCCPMSADAGGIDEPCAAWETWAEFLGAEERLPKSWDIEGWLVEYASYIIVAVSIPTSHTTVETSTPFSYFWPWVQRSSLCT
jgi:chloride channel 3/4/5